jgi:hypothetical protein
MMTMTNNRSNTAAWLVLAVTAVALIIGWGLRSFAQGRTRSVTEDGLSATVPAGWLVVPAESGPLGDEGGTGLVFTASDPLDPSTRYLVTSLPASPDADLAAAASIRNLDRAQDNTAYRVLEQTPVTLKGRDGYRVTFAFVDASQVDAVPVVYEGVDYYFIEDGQTLIVTLETSDPLEEALAAFQDFAAGVTLGE